MPGPGGGENRRSRPAPLSYAQQREWALERFRPSNNISGATRIEGELDLDLLGRILTEVTARHEVLRSTVEMHDRTPVQVVHPVTAVPTPVTDLRDLDPVAQHAEVRRLCDAEVRRPFPPEQPQRMRVRVLRLADDRHVVLLSVHHASSDGWSAAIGIRIASVHSTRSSSERPVFSLPKTKATRSPRSAASAARVAAWRGGSTPETPRREVVAKAQVQPSSAAPSDSKRSAARSTSVDLTAILRAISCSGTAMRLGFTRASRVRPMTFMARAAAPRFPAWEVWDRTMRIRSSMANA